MMPLRSKGKSRLLPIVLLASAAPLLGGCGGSSSAPASSTATTADTAQSATVATTAKAPGHHRPDPVRTGHVVKKPMHGTGGAELNDDNPSHADTGGHCDDRREQPLQARIADGGTEDRGWSRRLSGGGATRSDVHLPSPPQGATRSPSACRPPTLRQ